MKGLNVNSHTSRQEGQDSDQVYVTAKKGDVVKTAFMAVTTIVRSRSWSRRLLSTWCLPSSMLSVFLYIIFATFSSPMR